jgi:putative nucleotidyltransferase with HDIG domain
MAMLVLQMATGAHEFELGEHNWLGRHKKNTVRIEDPRVSAEHCLIYRDKVRGYIVRDLKSKNGTYINEKRLLNEGLLRSGDTIRLGDTKCLFFDAASSADKVIEIGEQLSHTHIHTTVSPVHHKQFLPANKVRNVAELRNDYEKLRVTYELQRDIGLHNDIGEVLTRILDRTFEFLHYDHGVVLLADRDGVLRARAHKVRKSGDKVYISSTVVQHVQKEKKGIISVDTHLDNGFKMSESLIMRGVRSTIAAPILSGRTLLGVLIIDSAASANAFTEKDLDLITTIAGQTAQILQNSILLENVRLSFDSSIQTLAAVVDARHPFTAGHSERVMFYASLVARQMGLCDEKLEVLRYAALLHDIGKIGIADRVLLKDGKFTAEEMEEMKTHPAKTQAILENFHFPPALADVPKVAAAHHEWFNGSGYPQGLKEDKIPLLSRILAIADVFDALSSQRDYPKYVADETLDRSPMPLDKAIKIIREEAGEHFDRKIVEAFIDCLPLALFRYRGTHFTKEYVDGTIRSLAPDLLPRI